MNNSTTLSNIPEKALAKFLEIGYTEIERRLHQFLDKKVQFDKPEWNLESKSSIQDFFSSMPRLAVVVEQEFTGSYKGKGFLIIDKKDGLRLAEIALEEEIPEAESLSEEQADTLKEIGNIAINGLICAADNYIGDRHDFEVPRCFLGEAKQILNTLQHKQDDFPILITHTNFQISDQKIQFVIGVSLDNKSINSLAEALSNIVLT